MVTWPEQCGECFCCSSTQYEWNESETFLFRATIAFAMRQHFATETYKWVRCTTAVCFVHVVSFFAYFVASMCLSIYLSMYHTISTMSCLWRKCSCCGVVSGLLCLVCVCSLPVGWRNAGLHPQDGGPASSLHRFGAIILPEMVPSRYLCFRLSAGHWGVVDKGIMGCWHVSMDTGARVDLGVAPRPRSHLSGRATPPSVLFTLVSRDALSKIKWQGDGVTTTPFSEEIPKENDLSHFLPVALFARLICLTCRHSLMKVHTCF